MKIIGHVHFLIQLVWHCLDAGPYGVWWLLADCGPGKTIMKNLFPKSLTWRSRSFDMVAQKVDMFEHKVIVSAAVCFLAAALQDGNLYDLWRADLTSRDSFVYCFLFAMHGANICESSELCRRSDQLWWVTVSQAGQWQRTQSSHSAIPYLKGFTPFWESWHPTLPTFLNRSNT